MQAQWKQKCENCDSDACIYVPGSTVNQGRNALWAELLRTFPGTIFTYIILLDGEHHLSFRREHVHTQHAFLEGLDPVQSARKPYYVWEQVYGHCLWFIWFLVWDYLQMLLEYQPALGAIFFTQQTLSTPPYPTSIYSILHCIFWHPNPASPAFNLWGHVQQGLEVQFVSNFDHIMVLFMLPYNYAVSSCLHVDWRSGRHSLQRCIHVSAYGDVVWWCVVVERAVHI